MWDDTKPNEFYPEDTIMFYGETLKTLEHYSYHTEVEECLYYHQGLSIIYTYSNFSFIYQKKMEYKKNIQINKSYIKIGNFL